MYKKVEYVVQPTSNELTPTTDRSSEPIVVGEDPSYYSTTPSDQQASAEVIFSRDLKSMINRSLKFRQKHGFQCLQQFRSLRETLMKMIYPRHQLLRIRR